MKSRTLLVVSALVAATGALAHQGVNNTVVKARMDSMSEIAENIKILGNMAKGTDKFDAESARTAAGVIADEAAKTAVNFEAQETDPKSEAKTEIWDNFEDFSRKANELERVALGYSSSITNLDELRAAMGTLGETCKSCHSVYRK
ncbi:MAG: cytochrome c [Stappiaceae bacterium]